jgi:hypothetical protein
MQLQLAQGIESRLSAEAVELLPMDANDVTEIAIPSEDRPDNFVEFWETQAIRHRDEPDNHGAHLTENRS